MRDGKQRRSTADGRESARCATVQLELRWTSQTDHFDVAPEDALRVAGAKRLHRGCLRREPPGKMDGRLGAAAAVRHFAIGENAVQKPFAVPLDCVGNAVDLGGVKTQADDV